MMHRYSSLSAYGQSKLANVLHANELARRLQVLFLLKYIYHLALWLSWDHLVSDKSGR